MHGDNNVKFIALNVFSLWMLQCDPFEKKNFPRFRESYCLHFETEVKTAVGAVPWLRRLLAGLSPRRHRFNPGIFHLGFVVGKEALGQVSPRILRFSPANFIPPVLHYTEKRKN
jgi:hypothetical protein